LRKFRALLPAILTKFKAQGPATVAVHFNVSAYAPYDVVSRLFYSFILFGVFWDESNGDMEFILPNIRWSISTYHPFPFSINEF
jgi:hypothetical protein